MLTDGDSSTGRDTSPHYSDTIDTSARHSGGFQQGQISCMYHTCTYMYIHVHVHVQRIHPNDQVVATLHNDLLEYISTC